MGHAHVSRSLYKTVILTSKIFLSSDRYNNGNYPPNQHCSNRIVSVSTGITFEINAFHTEDDNDEVYFTVQPYRNYVFDGDHTVL
jgi:hypothetical protein